jgi:hypothetical protein
MENLKQYYDGFLITDKLSSAMNKFQEEHPDWLLEVEALERFLEKEGYYSKSNDREAA